jgi:hypothetical protein
MWISRSKNAIQQPGMRGIGASLAPSSAGQMRCAGQDLSLSNPCYDKTTKPFRGRSVLELPLCSHGLCQGLEYHNNCVMVWSSIALVPPGWVLLGDGRTFRRWDLVERS